MAKWRITTDYRNRFGIARQDVRIIEATDDADRRRQVMEISEEIISQPGCTPSGGRSTPL